MFEKKLCRYLTGTIALITMAVTVSGCGKAGGNTAAERTKDDRIVITLGSVDMNEIDDLIMSYAEQFNEENKEYRIEIKDYSENEDPTAAFNMDVAAGKCPDIILSERSRIARLIHIGLMEDLMPFLEKDPDIQKEDMMDNVMEAWTEGKDTLYYMATNYTIDTVFGKPETVARYADGWTKEEMVEFANESDTPLFYMNSKMELFYFFTMSGLDEFMDWDHMKAKFDSRLFRDILEYCNKKGAPVSEHLFTDTEAVESLVDGKCRLDTIALFSFMDLEDTTRKYKTDIICIGAPNANKYISNIAFRNCFGISSKSQYQDVAWGFVKSFFTKQGQYEVTRMNCFAVRKDVYEMERREVTTKETYTDEFGKKVEPLNAWSEDMIYTPLTDEEIEPVDQLIAQARHCVTDDISVDDIIYEEVSAYFNGDCTIDRVGETINSRVETYMNENR